MNQKISGYISNLLSNGVDNAIQDIKKKINGGLTFTLHEGDYQYTFVPINVKYNSDDYFVFIGHFKDKDNLYELFVKIKRYKLFKCFIQGSDQCVLNIDQVTIN